MRKQKAAGYVAEAGSSAASRARHLFMAQLDAEITKVTVFYLGVQDVVDAQIHSLRLRLAELREAMMRSEDLSSDDGGAAAASVIASMTAEIAATCRDISREIVRALNFVELNLTGLRKILKKHDKKTTMSANEIVSAGGRDGLSARAGLTGLFLQSYQAGRGALSQYSGLRALHSLEWSSGAIDEVQDLHEELVRLAVSSGDAASVFAASEASAAEGADIESGDPAAWLAAAADGDLVSQLTEVHDAIARMEDAQARARQSGVFLGGETWLSQLVAVDYWSRQAGITNLRIKSQKGAHASPQRGIEVLYGELGRLNTRAAIRRGAPGAHHSASESDADAARGAAGGRSLTLEERIEKMCDIEDEIEELKQQLRFHLIVEKLELKGTRVTTPLSLWINLFSTLLYMVNYNVVLPTSNECVANTILLFAPFFCLLAILLFASSLPFVSNSALHFSAPRSRFAPPPPGDQIRGVCRR